MFDDVNSGSSSTASTTNPVLLAAFNVFWFMTVGWLLWDEIE